MAFNPEYLLDGLEVTTGDEVSLETVDALKPATVRLDEQQRLPVPADAGAGVLSRPGRAGTGRDGVQLRRLWLTDFRSYAARRARAATRAVCGPLGPNGVGKSNLLEAVGYLATLASFRGAPSEALIAAGAESAVVRGEVVLHEPTVSGCRWWRRS